MYPFSKLNFAFSFLLCDLQDFGKGLATDPILTPEEHPVPISVAVYSHAVEPVFEVDENVRQHYVARIAIEHGYEDELEDDFLQKVEEEGGILPARSVLYTLAADMEDSEGEPFVHGSVLQMNPDSSPGFISGLPTFDEAANLLISHPDLDANDSSKTENQLLSRSSSNCLKTLESSEGETESLYNYHFCGYFDYEPRTPIQGHSFTGQ